MTIHRGRVGAVTSWWVAWPTAAAGISLSWWQVSISLVLSPDAPRGMHRILWTMGAPWESGSLTAITTAESTGARLAWGFWSLRIVHEARG